MTKTVYNLLPAQVEFHNKPDNVDMDFAVYQGGFGSGKTWSGSLLGLRLAQKHPGSVGLVVAKTYPMVRDTTLKAYFEHIDAIGLRLKKHYTFLKAEGKLIFHCWGGSEIMFKHLENPEKIKSLNCDWIEVEEMSQLDEADFLMIQSRLRGSKGCLRFFGHTNPQSSKDWIYKYFVENAGNKTNQELGITVSYRRIIAPTTENIHLPKGYVQNMADSYTEAYYRQNVLGEDGDYREGLVVPNWSIANEFECSYDPSRIIYLTCDFNVDPMCWEVAHITNNNGVLEYEFFDELAIPDTNIIKTAEEFANRYGKHRKGVVITGDSTGKNRSDASPNPNDTKYKLLKQTLSDVGMVNVNLDVMSSNPHIDIRIETWNGLVCNKNGVRRIKVNPHKCPKLIWNMNNLKFIPGTSIVYVPATKKIEKDASDTLKYSGHPFDAASYLTYRYSPLKKDLLPQNGTTKVNTAQFSTGRY